MTDAQRMLMAQEGTGPIQNGRFLPYNDSVGKLTIGYGHLLEKGIPSEVAMMLFQCDLADAIQDVRALFSCYETLTRPRQLVLISMSFNLGRERLGQWPHFIAAVHESNWEGAAEALLDSKAARVQAPGRYRQLAETMRSNVIAWV